MIRSILFALIACLISFTASKANAQELNVVSLGNAVTKTLSVSPRLEALKATMKASEGDQQQAGMRLNPELSLTAENFMGRGPYNGYSGAETTAQISQTIELGGKMANRRAIAAEGVAISSLDLDIERLSLIKEVRIAYANAVAAQERLKMAEEQKTLAEKLYDEVSTRVGAAREPPIQKSKAQITLSTARFAREKAARELDHTKHVLASYWNEHEKDFVLDGSYFFAIMPPITEKEAEAALEKGVDLKRMELERARLQAAHRLEQARAMPDPTVGLGIRDFRETNDQALVASVSMPIPVFNRNSGAIERARQNIAAVQNHKAATRISLINELHEAQESMINAYEHAISLRDSTLPAAKQAFAQSRSGYNAGKTPYIEVLDAQRTLFDVNAQFIDTLNNYHTAQAVLDRLMSNAKTQGGIRE